MPHLPVSQNLNDNAPVCMPVSYESTIFSTRSAALPILSLHCSDADNDVLTATITNGMHCVCQKETHMKREWRAK